MEVAIPELSTNSHATRVAILFVNYGPYHVARARALSQVPSIDAHFIELAATEGKYPWQGDKRPIKDRLLTLTEKRYEDSSCSELASRVRQALTLLMPEVIAVAGYSEPPMRAAAEWASKYSVPVVMMGDSVRWDHTRSWWREAVKRWWVRRHAQAGFVAGSASLEYMAELGIPRSQIWTGYDVVENKYFESAVDEIRRSLNPPSGSEFLTVCRFAPEKNLISLLEGYADYCRDVTTPWRLTVVGDGPQRSEIEACIRNLGLSVECPGFKFVSELPKYYASASAFVLPSVREPWGLVVNEAMASGLPVLVSNRCGCCADLVQEGRNGYAFDPDKEDIARVLKLFSELSLEQRMQMGQASRELIANYSPEMWAQNLTLAMQSTLKRISAQPERVQAAWS